MIVVSDNGPVAFLVQIGLIDLLPRLYGSVLLPPAVLLELRRAETPIEIQRWAVELPDWVDVQAPTVQVDRQRVGWGEREAIQLAKERSAFLLCDDRAAMNQARREGLRVTGTLGVLQIAHAKGWIEIESALTNLRNGTEFRFPSEARLGEIVREARDLRATPPES